MTDRTTKVTLTAQVSNYIAGMQAAAKATNATGSAAQKLGQQKEAFSTVGTALLGIGTVAAVGVGLAIKKFADFDAQMSQVKALSHATAGEMDDLTQAALNMGQAIGFSANEVADAETELVKAGVSVKDILGGALKGSLDLAAAGQIDVAQATEIASSAMVQFGLKGQDVTHIADLLAAGADKALGGVSDLGVALKYAGPVAASLGVSLEETVGTLAAFASNGILADQAGTSLRGVLSSLTSPSAQANDVMKKYGITLFDSAGKFIGLAGAAGQLHDKLGPLTQAERSYALGQIFGNQQVTAANILMKDGAAGISKWTKAVNDQGFAAQQAAGKMDNLNGDLKKLGAAFESGLIKTGSTADGVLRQVVQSVTALVRGFSDLGAPAQSAILIIGALVAGVGLLGGGFLTAVGKIASFKTAIDTLGVSMRGVGLAGGAVGLAITGLVTILAAVAGAQAEAQARTDEFTASLDQNTGAITKNTREIAVKQLHDNSSIQAANKLGISLQTITDASLGNAKALVVLNKAQDEFNKKKQAAIAAGKGDSNEIQNQIHWWTVLASGVGSTSSSLKDAQRDFKNNAEAMAESENSAAGTTSGLGNLSAAARDASDSVDALNKQLLGLGQTNLDASSATIKFNQAIANANDAISKNGATLDLSTQAGRDNQSALDDVASSGINLVAAQQKAGASASALTATMQSARDQFINAAVAAGMSAEAAAHLADQYGLVPSNVSTAFQTSGADDAIAKANAIQAAMDAITKDFTINVRFVQQGSPPPTRSLTGFAEGGLLPGPPSAKDNMLIHAASGEFVTRASAASVPSNRAMLEYINRGGVVRGYANGGAVAPKYVSAPSAPTVASGSAVPPSFDVVLSQKGGVDLLQYVDVQIVQAQHANDRAAARGYRG